MIYPKSSRHYQKQPPYKEPPYELVTKEVCGQTVPVKVFKPAWAAGDQRDLERLGLKNPFKAKLGRGGLSCEKPKWIYPKARGKKSKPLSQIAKANEVSMVKFPSKSKKSKKK
jgi:hypothetical protein